MNIELIIASWILEILEKENIINDTVSDGAKKIFLRNLSTSIENSEPETKAA